MIQEQYNNLSALVNETIADVEKFDSGNKAAGGRVRKALQEIKKLAQDIRKNIQEQKKAKSE